MGRQYNTTNLEQNLDDIRGITFAMYCVGENMAQIGIRQDEADMNALFFLNRAICDICDSIEGKGKKAEDE